MMFLKKIKTFFRNNQKLKFGGTPAVFLGSIYHNGTDWIFNPVESGGSDTRFQPGVQTIVFENSAGAVIPDIADIIRVYGVSVKFEQTAFTMEPSSGSSVTDIRNAYGAGANITLQRANGTKAVPTNINNGAQISNISFKGYHGGTYYDAAQIRATIDAAIGASAETPTRLGFFTTPDGSTTLAERLRITNGGDVKIVADSKRLYFGTGDDMSIDYDGTQGNINTDLVAPSDLHIDCGTDKTVVLDETVWDDMQFPIATGKVPAANFPNYEALTTNTQAFAFSVDDYIDLQANEPPHGWKEGSDGSVHLHFAVKTAQNSGANRYAKFTVYLAYADVNEVWTETSVTAEYTIPTGTAALTHLLLSVGTLTLTNNLIGTHINARVKRIAATGGTEYADDVFITQVGIHFEKDTVGSRTITTK